MVILMIPKPDIPTTLGWTHDGTDWQLATSPEFKDDDIVVESKADTENKISIIFDNDLDPETTYYGRARVICNKGIFDWSHVGVVKVTDFIKVAFDYPIPSMVMAPELDIVNVTGGEVIYEDAPAAAMSFRPTPISTTSNSERLYTSFIIEKLDGTPVFTDLENSDSSNTYVQSKFILEEGIPYIIKAAHTATSNDTSDFASKVIYVKARPDIKLKTNNINVNPTGGIPIALEPIENFKSMRYVLIAVVDTAEIVYAINYTDSLSAVIPQFVFEESHTDKYILAIEVKYQDDSESGYKYFPLTIDGSISLDSGSGSRDLPS